MVFSIFLQDLAGLDSLPRTMGATMLDDESYGTMFMQLDVSLIGVLLVIDLGSRDAARAALPPIEDTLTKLAERLAPPR